MKKLLGVLLVAMATVAIVGCGGGGGSEEDAGNSRLRYINPRDGETSVAIGEDVEFGLTSTPNLLTAGLFYWAEDTDGDDRVDYPDEVEGVETTFHYDSITRIGTLENFYNMYDDTVYLVLLELNEDDVSITFTTEEILAGAASRSPKRPQTPKGIDINGAVSNASPKIVHVVMPK
jgi:hypothetical protein